MSKAVVTEGLQVRYGRQVVIDGLDVTIGRGATALLGPNGAGKTTLMHVLCGLRRPSAGSIHVVGVDMTRRSAVREVATRLGFLPQHSEVAGGFTVEEFVRYAA